MSTEYQYERLPTTDEKRRYPRQEPTSDVRELHRRLAQDPRFNPPTPSAWKRIALIVFLFVLLWGGYKLRLNAIQQTGEKVVHAQRYSKDFKFRPAASPIITEKLKDGRTRLRGAAPTFR
ncbi:hypothetical protein L226DRAFT_470955 [Lentinus tigrinus ALCF2SS1-7]|uniref:Uncharacterized protein n=1 Tax=Lentinus tigrinus ALCF2SS1-6 TaxID=1328759 RepID=A0A5C2RVR6_9APHY|nr:hypothetical protein L227DRAFT_580199 [Lentinus tigrinus ALCF2SS1-6]RPD69914.1 hypothetical protein L226DRAFT_470955 [Lentinus tigrinus ALCF2SS1-7]